LTRAKLFTIGGRKAVELPEGFGFSGESVRIRRQGRRVILEPDQIPVGRSPEEIRAWLADIQALAGGDIERPEPL
jgi:virulence-associated protein VagC